MNVANFEGPSALTTLKVFFWGFKEDLTKIILQPFNPFEVRLKGNENLYFFKI